MLSTAIISILTIAAKIVPLVTSSAEVAKIVEAVTTLAPSVINGIEGGAQAIKNVIKGLKENEAITDADWDLLDTYEAKIDADWDEAKAKAQAEDKAAGQ